MKWHLRRLFRVFTLVLLLLTIGTAYANVVSDDSELRVRAGELVRKTAGCGEACKITAIRGSRGMIEESLEYDIDKLGGFVVTCRRAWIGAGDYACEAQKR